MSTVTVAVTWEVFSDGEFVGEVHRVHSHMFTAYTVWDDTSDFVTKRAAVAWLVQQFRNGE